jgi:hypothetical protein
MQIRFSPLTLQKLKAWGDRSNPNGFPYPDNHDMAPPVPHPASRIRSPAPSSQKVFRIALVIAAIPTYHQWDSSALNMSSYSVGSMRSIPSYAGESAVHPQIVDLQPSPVPSKGRSFLGTLCFPSLGGRGKGRGSVTFGFASILSAQEQDVRERQPVVGRDDLLCSETCALRHFLDSTERAVPKPIGRVQERIDRIGDTEFPKRSSVHIEDGQCTVPAETAVDLGQQGCNLIVRDMMEHIGHDYGIERGWGKTFHVAEVKTDIRPPCNGADGNINPSRI